VLDVLNDKRLKAAKRAAVITTALQWLLARVPLRIVPVQFRGGVLIARRLVPYIGYIGSFVAWSWGAITSYDKGTRNCGSSIPSEIDPDPRVGHGVVLTATWLLPLALIPGTWERNEEGNEATRPTSPTSAARTRSQAT
jgi:hypothetical protein